MTNKVESSCKTDVASVNILSEPRQKCQFSSISTCLFYFISLFDKPTPHLTAPLTKRDRNCNIAKTD